jgi:hypothetical protein
MSTSLIGFWILATCQSAFGQPAPQIVLANQPGAPLEVISMRPVGPPAQASPQVAQKMKFFELVLRNTSNVPIVAYAISHEVRSASASKRICQASMGFTNPMLKAGETMTIQSSLHDHGGTGITPVIDLVLLENGSFFGEDSCGYLKEYGNRADERLTAYRLILQRLETDGADRTQDWLKKELSRNWNPLLTPKRITATSPSR